jgi:hypothetical protein
MSFCTLDEAFAGPSMGAANGTKKKSKQGRTGGKEGFVPGPLSGTPDPDRPAVVPPPPANDVLSSGPPSDRSAAQMESGVAMKLDSLFPLPGETGGVDEWEKAFMLDGSQAPSIRPDGFAPAMVAGGPTLWRQAAALVPAAVPTIAAAPVKTIESTLAGIPADVTHRLETLTRQLESLTTPSPMQGTAELFLFVAIGLLLLLAIDTLLRFAVSVAKGSGPLNRKMMGGARGHWGGRSRFY